MLAWLEQQLRFVSENIIRYVSERLWIRPALVGVFSIALAFAGLAFDQVARSELPIVLSKDALSNLLSIFSSSMLAVATFSVSAMVTAVSAVSNSTTPRATRLVLQDATAQNVIASFIGAFVYSLVALLALEAFEYGNAGRLFLFAGLAAIVVWVLVSFLKWVDHVTTLGRVGPTIEKLTTAACNAITEDSVGTFGAQPFTGVPPRNGSAVMADEVGYIANIDVAGLNALAEQSQVVLYVTARPGDLVDTTTPLFFVSPASSEMAKVPDQLLRRVSIEAERTYQKDIRLGLLNLAETADRALSPGINDPGTAISILTKQLQVISRWVEVRRDAADAEVRFDRLYIPPLSARCLIDDAFTAVSRDGAGIIEVGIALQKCLQAIVRLGDEDLSKAALEQSHTALEIAEAALVADSQKERLRAEAKEVAALCGKTIQ